MRPKYYVHMGPRTADKVSILWKGLHLTLFLLIVVSATIATFSIYEIIKMYNFNCILYAKISFEDSYEERTKNATRKEVQTTVSTTLVANGSLEQPIGVNCTAEPDNPQCQNKKIERRLLVIDWKSYRAFETNDTIEAKRNNEGFINLRKTAFATDYMCDLMFFSPIASIIMAFFLGALTMVGGKGGAGNPGDLFPNPWVCVYPFLGLCVFMLVFSFIAQNLFYSGLNSFCRRYVKLTGIEWCSEEMDKYTRQFTPHRAGSPKPFYYNYLIGRYSMQVTSGLWVLQALVYICRIIFLADFSTYVTRIRLADDQKRVPEQRMANFVMTMVDQSKVKKNF